MEIFDYLRLNRSDFETIRIKAEQAGCVYEGVHGNKGNQTSVQGANPNLWTCPQN